MDVIEQKAQAARSFSAVGMLELAAKIGFRSDEGFPLVYNEHARARLLTDEDLASSAFDQAVALYDSCVRCVTPSHITADSRPLSKGIATK